MTFWQKLKAAPGKGWFLFWCVLVVLNANTVGSQLTAGIPSPFWATVGTACLVYSLHRARQEFNKYD
jgi:hypothetical protein